MNQEAISQIATTLARHFDSLYYVNIETGHYNEFMSMQLHEQLELPSEGDDFFEGAKRKAKVYVHPDDLDMVNNIYDKKTMIENLKNRVVISPVYRLLVNEKILHMRQIAVMCSDMKHMICCIENVEADYLEKEEQQKNLRTAEIMARRDELTGVRNNNAFIEQRDAITKIIKSGKDECQFGIVMCDLNDLKRINDTRGHKFGDEAIQKTSRVICDIFKHSPVFRIGGDEFAVILHGADYEHREQLFKQLRGESAINKRMRSGPVIACGLAIYESKDPDFMAVFERADQMMYQNKILLKSEKESETFGEPNKEYPPITDERRRKLDVLFGALFTVAGGGYVYLNDMKHDYSRWALPLIDDFGLDSEYMYHAGDIWEKYIHPDDLEIYKEAVDKIFLGNAELKLINYRARKKDGTYVKIHTRGFVLVDCDGQPDYFGGIMIPD